MNKYKNIFFIILICALSSNLFPGIDLHPGLFLSSNEMLLTKNGEILTSVTLKDKGDVRTPGVEIASPVSNGFLPPASDFDMVAVEKGFFRMENSAANRQKMYRAATDFPGLSGMIYYSKSDGIFSKLILYSYRIQSEDSYVKAGSGKDGIPEQTVSRFAIKDNRLGLLSFKSEITASGDNFMISGISTGTVTKLGMTIFYPGDYRIYKFFIYDRSLKGYFFYTAQFMKIRSDVLNKMDLVKPESFGNRIRAENVHFMKSIGVDRTGKLAAFK